MNFFGDRLKFFRIYVLKLTRHEFCALFGFAELSLQSWENKSSNISKAKLLDIQRILELKEIDYNQPWLINGIGNPFEIPNTKNNTIRYVEMPDFGDRLKFFRIHILNMQRKEFSSAYGISAISIQSWESKISHISKSKLKLLETNLKNKQVPYNHQWLFDGVGHPFENTGSKNSLEHNTNVNGARVVLDTKESVSFSYRITNSLFEPLYPQNTTLFLEAIHIHDVRCPSFIALKDPYEMMHFGILNESWNKEYVFYGFQVKPYSIVLNEKYKVYRVQNITFDA